MSIISDYYNSLSVLRLCNMTTLVNVYVDLMVFTRIAGTS